jgi:hypothetical protein
MLFDERQHHADALLCFDAPHAHPVPWPAYANDNELVRRFREQTQQSPEFLYSGEGLYDWDLEQYHLSYFHSATTTHNPLARYLNPHAALMTAATSFDLAGIGAPLAYRLVDDGTGGTATGASTCQRAPRRSPYQGAVSPAKGAVSHARAPPR